MAAMLPNMAAKPCVTPDHLNHGKSKSKHITHMKYIQDFKD